MNDLFKTWYTASESVINQASFIVQPIITEIDLQRKTTLDLSSLLSATIAGFPYLTTSYTATPAGLSYNSPTTSRALQNSLQNTPAVAKALFPTSTINPQQITISSLPSALENSTNQISQLLNNALALIMTDMPTFIAFTSSGAYTDSTSLSLPPQVPGIDLALKTYILSSALSANGYIAHVTKAAAQAECPENDPALCANRQKITFSDSSTGLVFSMGSDGSTQSKISESDFEEHVDLSVA